MSVGKHSVAVTYVKYTTEKKNTRALSAHYSKHIVYIEERV